MDEAEFEAMKVLLDKKKKLLDTTELVHSEAYDKVVRELLMDENDKVDYSKLKDSDMQLKFADKLKEHYLKAAKGALNVKESKGELEDEMLLQAYTGATSEYFRTAISELKHRYTKKTHNERSGNLLDAQDKQLTPIVYKKVKNEDIEDVIKHVGAEKYIDHKKVTRDHAIELLKMHYETGVTPKMVEHQDFYKK
ncbi:MAG: hypothetical protein V1831_02415 [Candidatus Woesearchaeota archaeon]